MIAFATPDNRIDTLPLGVVLHGDALAVLKTMETSSVDAIVTDPPAGIKFMGKDWDNPDTFPIRDRTKEASKGGFKDGRKAPRGLGNGFDGVNMSKKARDAFIAFLTSVMSEALRVLRPGGHALVWALPRTSHWTALALEDAGFEIRDCVYHVFGSGFPKSTAIDKQIDKMLGAEREVVGEKEVQGGWHHEATINDDGWKGNPQHITAPATPEAAQWDGWGTALKPAVECWWLCRKPLAEPSIAANVLKYGVGGINVDACRVGYASESDLASTEKRLGEMRQSVRGKVGMGAGNEGWKRPWMEDEAKVQEKMQANPQGRWPANLLLSHSWLCTEDACHPDLCPIRLLDEQSGVRKSGLKTAQHADNRNGLFSLPSGNACYSEETGGASRYFTNLPPDVPFLYTSKASRAERNAGCEGLPEQKRNATKFDGAGGLQHRIGEDGKITPKAIPAPEGNNHPTVKSLSLMRWLVRLVTPPDGIVLDPFLGSGSTAVACVQEGYHFIGIEQDASYVAIAEARIAHARREVG